MRRDRRQVQVSFTRKELCDLDVALCLAEDELTDWGLKRPLRFKDLRIKILASIPFLTEEEEDTDA